MSDQPMYKVIGADGNTYGPVDFETLKSWVADNRLKPDTQVINESTGVQSQARFIPGLFEGGSAQAEHRMPPAGSDEPVAQKSRTSTWMVVLAIFAFGCCGCGVLGAAILFPVFSQAKVAAQRSLGLSSLKQLSTGVMIYMSDYDDKFPPHMESALAAKPALDPYTKNAELYKSVNPAGGEIKGDGRLSKRSAAELINPADTIMFYDSMPWDGNRAMIAYTDSHAKVVTPFTAIRDGLSRKIFETKKP